MPYRFSDLIKFEVHGRDDVLGTLADLFFDDGDWRVRYAVVETGGWFRRRRTLIATDALEQPYEDHPRIDCALTREQFERSPDVSERPPISRDEESRYREFFGWPRYWGGFTSASTFGLTPEKTAMAEFQAKKEAEMLGARSSDLRSMEEVRGYDLASRDGPVGQVDDFIVDDESWLVRYLVVTTGNLFSGKRVPIEPSEIDRVQWIERNVVVNLTQDEVRHMPEYNPKQPLD